VKIDLNRDWTEFLSALIARRVRFVLVGGHAVAAHGEPRLTEDLDVFVEPTLANARRLREALGDFGFGDIAPSAEELAEPDRIFMLGRKPWRIDVLTGIDGVTFANLSNRRFPKPALTRSHAHALTSAITIGGICDIVISGWRFPSLAISSASWNDRAVS
jgi:hypothetical protein